MNLAVGENASFDERGEFMAVARLEYLQDENGVYGVSIPRLTYNGTSSCVQIGLVGCRKIPRTVLTPWLEPPYRYSQKASSEAITSNTSSS